MITGLSFAQTSTTEINKIIKEQSDGIVTSSQEGVSTVYKDGTSVVKTVYNDAKSLSPKIESAIKSLATELKTTTDALWDILVRQQLVWSIGFLILTLTSIFNWYLFYKRNLNIKLTEENFVKGKKIFKEAVNNPDYSSYANINDLKGQRFLFKDTTEEEILIPIINPNTTWFKYLHLIMCLSLSLLSIYHFSDMLTGFINPEFGALKTIAEIAIKLK
jgi:hypothetical protein